MSADPQGGMKVEKFIGYQYDNGMFFAGDDTHFGTGTVDHAVPINLSAHWSPPANLVLITRTTTPGAPTLEAVPLREGDVLHGPYVVAKRGTFFRAYPMEPFGPLAEAFRFEYVDNAILWAGDYHCFVHRLLTRPGAPVVTYTVQPLAEVCGVTP